MSIDPDNKKKQKKTDVIAMEDTWFCCLYSNPR